MSNQQASIVCNVFVGMLPLLTTPQELPAPTDAASINLPLRLANPGSATEDEDAIIAAQATTIAKLQADLQYYRNVLEVDLYSKQLSIRERTLLLAHDFAGYKQVSDISAKLLALTLANDFEGCRELMRSSAVLKLSLDDIYLKVTQAREEE